MPTTRFFPILLLGIIFYSCEKNVLITEKASAVDTVATTKHGYTKYTIAKGDHYCDKNIVKSVELKELRFKVKFDSSAIYTTSIASNQYDINKLYGFSEGYDHHQNSARIGWAWHGNALKLYAYAYNKGIMKFAEITPVAIGAEVNCSISVSAQAYLFTVNGIEKKIRKGKQWRMGGRLPALSLFWRK